MISIAFASSMRTRCWMVYGKSFTMASSRVRMLSTVYSHPISRTARGLVTREEDIAYCLMGIFDVSNSTAYGEGAERAFFRLVEEIFRTTKDVSDIFNWSGYEPTSRKSITSLFPSRPSDYFNRSLNQQLRPWRPIEPLTLTHFGLRTPVLLMPAILIHSLVLDHQPIGDYHGTVSTTPLDHIWSDSMPKKYHLLDKRVSGPEGIHGFKHWLRKETTNITLAFGILNVEEQGNSIYIPKTCLAVLLKRKVESSSTAYEKVYTKKPIVFELRKTITRYTYDRDQGYYQIERSRLGSQGMQLVTLHL